MFVALYLLLHLFPVLQGGVDVLSRLHAVLRAQQWGSCHRVSDAADGVRRPAHAPLPCGDGVQRSVHLPGLVDLLLCPAALLDQVGVRVRAVGVVHPAHRVGQILVVPGVQPLVDPVELVRYAVLGKAGSQLLRPAGAVGHGPAAHVLQHVPALRRYAPLPPHVQRPGCCFRHLLRRASALCSSARHFTSHRASSVQRKLARHASGSHSGGAGAQRLRGLVPRIHLPHVAYVPLGVLL